MIETTKQFFFLLMHEGQTRAHQESGSIQQSFRTENIINLLNKHFGS